jgi:hypothetical protein
MLAVVVVAGVAVVSVASSVVVLHRVKETLLCVRRRGGLLSLPMRLLLLLLLLLILELMLMLDLTHRLQQLRHKVHQKKKK